MFSFDSRTQPATDQSFELDQNPSKEESLAEQENRKAYTSLLQNQVLNLHNEELLQEIHNTDENHFYPDLYSEMQKKADSSASLHTPGSSNDIYCGAFAYTSPPERPI